MWFWILTSVFTFSAITCQKIDCSEGTSGTHRGMYVPVRSNIQAIPASTTPPQADLYSAWIPFFDDETDLMANVLDYILVDWPDSLGSMIDSGEGLLLLMRYARDALSALVRALNVGCNNNIFRYLLRSMWMRRAQRYYDSRDYILPYPSLLYNTRRTFPHTYSPVQNLVSHRRNQNFSSRNPEARREHREMILNIHRADRPNHEEIDVFNLYEIRMSSAEYYFETHVDQFYRLILFYLELQGVISVRYNVHERPLVRDIIPANLSTLLYDDAVYAEYLLERRREVIRRGGIENSILNNLERTARVREEDLIMAILNASPILRTFSNATSSTTTTTTKSISTTPRYQVSRNGKVLQNFIRVCQFVKEKIFPIVCCANEHQHSSTNVSNKHTESCLRERYNYIVSASFDQIFAMCSMIRQTLQRQKQQPKKNNHNSFVIHDQGLKYPLLIPERNDVFLQILSNLFGGPHINSELRRR